MEQQVDPRQAGVDWKSVRESQREAAREAVASSIVLEEVARRERVDVTEFVRQGRLIRRPEKPA